MTPDEIADELYGLPPEQFITTRNARAKELSDAGDRETAASIRKLQKPSPAAGLVNVLVRTHPEGIAEVVALGAEFRRAQKRGSGDDLRSLAATRRDLLRRLLTLAATETKAMGHQWTTGLERQIAATLEAAMADETLGAAVRRGRLTQPVSHVGFGDAPISGGPRSSRSDRTGSGRGPVSTRRQPVAPPVSEHSVEAAQALATAERSLDVADAALTEARRRYEEASEGRREAARALRDADKRQKETSLVLQEATRVHKRAAEALGVLKRRQGPRRSI